jgi:hypothetical protein
MACHPKTRIGFFEGENVMVKQPIFHLAVILCSAVINAAVAAPEPAAATAGVAAYNIPIQIPASATIGEIVAGPDGAYYAGEADESPGVFTSSLVRITDAGNVTVLDSSTTSSYSSLQFDRDGNLYGDKVGTSSVSAFSANTFFRVTSAGVFTALASFDLSTYGTEIYSNSFVQGADGASYGLATFLDANPLLYKVTADGSYSAICSATTTLDTYEATSLSLRAAGSDGSLYGTFIDVYGKSSVFRLTPSCDFSVVYSEGISISSLIMGSDGNLYATDATFNIASTTGYSTRVFKLTPEGVATDLHVFATGTYLGWSKGYWYCPRLPYCAWQPGQWQPFLDAINAEGNNPGALVQARDGYLYSITSNQGLNGGGTVFRLAADGGQFSTLYANPSPANFTPYHMMLNAEGNPVLYMVSHDNTKFLSTLKLDAPLATRIFFSQPQVKLGQASALTWSSTGAKSCTLIGDLPGWKTSSVALNGSRTVRLYSKGNRTPPLYTAGIECTAADGSISNAAATITIQ